MGLHFIKNGTKHDVCVKRPSLFPASATTYDNSISGLSANRVQGAIDELTSDLAWKTETAVNATSLTLSGDWEEAIIAWTPYPYATGRTTLTAHITKGIVNTVGGNFVVDLVRDTVSGASMLCTVSVSGNTFTLMNATWAGSDLLNSSRLTVSYR